VRALLRGRRAPHTDGYSAFDDVFHGHRDSGWASLSSVEYHRRRQIDPSYCNILPDGPEWFGISHPEAQALLRDAVFDGVAEDQGNCITINEHAVHALDDFWCEVYAAWAKYLDRLALARQACPIERSRALYERDQRLEAAKAEESQH
jgi:hypothetical protein